MALGGSTWKLLLEMFCFLSWVAVSGEFVLLCFIHNLYLLIMHIHWMCKYSIKKERELIVVDQREVGNTEGTM